MNDVSLSKIDLANHCNEMLMKLGLQTLTDIVSNNMSAEELRTRLILSHGSMVGVVKLYTKIYGEDEIGTRLKSYSHLIIVQTTDAAREYGIIGDDWNGETSMGING